MYVTAGPDIHKLFILSCEMAEPWWICLFMYLFTDCCMQSWNAASFLLLLAICCGEKKDFGFGSGSGSKFNCAARVGSDDLGYGPGSGFNFKPVQTSTPGWTTFSLQNCLNSSDGCWKHKVLEAFLKDVGPYRQDSIMQLLQICRLHIHDVNLSFHHIPRVLYWIEIWWLWRPFE